MASLEQLRAAYASNNKTDNESNNNFGLYYPFWNIKDDESCKLRFLPDANDANPLGFLAQKIMHNLMINGEKKNVPCLSMYGEDCPICKVSANFYKTEGKQSVNGKKYWKKKQYLAQAIVVDDPLPADPATGETHKGKLRYVALGYQVYKIIEESFKDSEKLESIPYEFENGYDFIIKKTKQGEYSTYTVGTDFARKQRSLTEAELVEVGEHLIDLETLLPKHPGREKVEAMLEAALNGGVYNESANAPSAANAQDDSDQIPFETSSSAPAATPAPAPAATPATPVAEPVAAVDNKAQLDINSTLERIRARRAATQQ